MGAQQSSGRGQPEVSSCLPAKTCYYVLLDVERDATDLEIKKAYRKRALELHPDRNLTDVENATRRFAEVQTAFDVLSDPQERAWYDSHRDAILHGVDPDELDANTTEYNNVRLTSTEDIFCLIRRFNTTIPFTDEPTGFFGIAKMTFDNLVDEEIAIGNYDPRNVPDYPSFGTSADNYENVAKTFYSAWANFSTRKTFAWKDKYRLSDAPDRRVRRLMEKENKKLREEATRDFNDAVRFLVTFVRKRDARYLPNTQTPAERQESLRTASAAQAARSRAANREKLSESAVPMWAQSHDDNDAGGQFSESGEEVSEVEQIECVVCNKTFKSEKSFEAHERSKKHIKAVQQLRRRIQHEDRNLNLHRTNRAPEISTRAYDRHNDVNEQEPSEMLDAQMGHDTPSTLPVDGKEDEPVETSSEPPDNDEYAPRANIKERLFADKKLLSYQLRQETSSDFDVQAVAEMEILFLDDDHPPQPQKVGKAKAKREKKAVRKAAEESQARPHMCGICTESFPSKTKLFSHLRNGHPNLISKSRKDRRRQQATFDL